MLFEGDIYSSGDPLEMPVWAKPALDLGDYKQVQLVMEELMRVRMSIQQYRAFFGGQNIILEAPNLSENQIFKTISTQVKKFGFFGSSIARQRAIDQGVDPAVLELSPHEMMYQQNEGYIGDHDQSVPFDKLRRDDQYYRKMVLTIDIIMHYIYKFIQYRTPLADENNADFMEQVLLPITQMTELVSGDVKVTYEENGAITFKYSNTMEPDRRERVKSQLRKNPQARLQTDIMAQYLEQKISKTWAERARRATARERDELTPINFVNQKGEGRVTTKADLEEEKEGERWQKFLDTPSDPVIKHQIDKYMKEEERKEERERWNNMSTTERNIRRAASVGKAVGKGAFKAGKTAIAVGKVAVGVGNAASKVALGATKLAMGASIPVAAKTITVGGNAAITAARIGVGITKVSAGAAYKGAKFGTRVIDKVSRY